ncbi:glutamate ABC transporter substrate-binding protein [Prauserella cavernicola]|uniref:Glutamate ABC transporter substrate-binding protein n=1 Tax=Prauserella cavernicola TaxID=2800127 RepID=A0A934QQ63_9PSEU|nr:glutamate ABC transporter substrate-binding protein [Prauserella cavernicola]MBK1786172.1 glutamate ABC transporter substrate-binding protein [Prauserella cavernicola]
MRFSRVLRVGAVAAATSLALVACGGGNGGGGDENESLTQRAENGRLTVGIKIDQPGLGLQTPDGGYEGFDVDVAKYIAKELGVEEGDIEFVETPSAQRENMIEKGDVDFIVASYSITDERKQKVDFAGPYFLAHQDLLVRADDNSIKGAEELNGKNLCSVRGSTSAQNVKDDFAPDAELQTYAGYSECLNGLETGAVDALTTDDTILAGYAAQNPGKFKLVGAELSDENYGVGLKKGDNEGRTAVNDAIKKMQDDGAWKASAEKWFGPSGYEVGDPPSLEQ